ncbi:MAG: SpoIID/LytB domain-containing protein [Candidatus Caldatribacteriaceae bacterium]
MKQILYLFLGIFLLGILGGMVWAKEVEVKVALWRGRETLSLSSPSGMRITLGQRTISLPGGEVAHFSWEEGKILWREKKLSLSQAVVTPAGREPLFWGKRPYRGRMILKAANGILLLNWLPLEDYLKGTIKLEVNPSWPPEALKAQIVVSRTYALKNLGRHKEEGFDFCATEHCQRYGGINAEDPRTNQLVESTRGMVLTYQGGFASVVFHSESGGYTDSALNVWGKEVPYLVEVPSPWEEDTPHAQWRVVLSREEIEKTLRKAGYLPESLEDLEFVPGENGRMKEVVLFTKRGRWVIPASRFREAVGVNVLLSTYFRVEREGLVRPRNVPVASPKPSSQVSGTSQVRESRKLLEKEDWTLEDIILFLELRERERKSPEIREESKEPALEEPPREEKVSSGEYFVFEGKGWGHGVGLSQWGAFGMARAGFSFPEILRHYFPGCELGQAVAK